MLFSLIFYHNREAGNEFARMRVLVRDGVRMPVWPGSIPVALGKALRRPTRHTSKGKGAVPMDFAAKLNVVAAYAAFAFVCAIVFGVV